MTTISFIGHLGKDAEAKEFNGTTVRSLSIAVKDRVKDADVTTWYRVNVWGSSYDNVSKYWTKGTALYIVGTLKPPQVYTDNYGMARTQLDVRAFQVSFVPGSTKKEERTSQGKIEPIQTSQHEQKTSSQQPELEDDDYLPF